MRFFKYGETADSKFTFLDPLTNQPIDINSAQYTIVHYNGATEVIDVSTTSLTKLTGKTGEYVCSWLIPGTVPENETYFVIATGERFDHTVAHMEDFYRVVPENFFPGSGGLGMSIKFTKP